MFNMPSLLLLLLPTLAACSSSSVWPPSAYTAALEMLSQLSDAEKVQLVSGQNANYQRCQDKSCSYVGWVPGLPTVGLSALYLEDGPQGVADGLRSVTAFPSAMTVAQAWNPALMQAWGAAMGAEQSGKGVNVMLGPAVALVRVPWGGRNFEYLSEDPVLNSLLTAPLVTGIQSNNISACVKHWIFGSQEANRTTMSANVAEGVGRELYMPPYKAAVDAGVGSVMCSFQRINNTWSCANSHWLTDVLKGELGFDGFVVSDWGAAHGTAASLALGGLDMEQEWQQNSTFYGASLLAAVQAGQVSRTRLNDMAGRVLLAMHALNFTAEPPAAANASAAVNSTAHAQLALDLARASLVLLKNADTGAGPLAPLQPGGLSRGLTVFDVAGSLISGGGSGSVVAPFVVSPAAGIAAAFGDGVAVVQAGTSNLTAAAAAAAASDASIVIVGIHSGEGSDRANLSLGSGQDELIAAIAAAQPNTIVVLRCPGACLMPWIDAVPVVFNQLYAGQAAGTALGEALAGLISPGGKLTVSFPRSMEDTWLSPPGGGSVQPTSYPGTDRGRGYPEVDFSEGLLVGYRWYQSQGTTPLFPFGHGLSYATFTYGSLQTTGSVSWDGHATWQCLVWVTTNDDSIQPAMEVVQLYVQSPGRPGDPPRALKGSCALDVARQALCHFQLGIQDLSMWSEEAGAWVGYPEGVYTVWVGSSSEDIRKTTNVTVTAKG